MLTANSVSRLTMITAMVIAALVACVSIALPRTSFAQSTATEAERDFIERQMRELAESTEVIAKTDDGERVAQLVEHPIFRYSDQPRDIYNATLWAWQLDGRPVVLQKIEAGIDHNDNTTPRWTHCLTSFSEHRVDVNWDGGRRYQSRKPGIEYRKIDNGPVPSDRLFVRRRQMKQLASRFAATITIDPSTGKVQEMRPLTTPLMEYTVSSDAPADGKPPLPTGAVFALAANGTNPDAYLVIDLHEPRAGAATWHYGAARMTICGLDLRLDKQTVWSVPFVEPVPTPFENWTFYYSVRDLQPK
ncbi:unnamed protein product [Cladocopium goreaui]|uniref:Uncharacterized protein n=1 Tax=Cladocopium goreaui TaxID=2562237 RepID=A0A9P1DP48_9DINO|nr:unnamed protein product [Cladocopium goreaui]